MSCSARAAGFAIAALLSLPLSLAAQSGVVGTIVIAHGGGNEWDAKVQTVAGMAETGGPVEVAFLMGPNAATHRFQDAAGRLAVQGVTEIVVVPLLVSSHSGHFEQIRYLAGETDELAEMMQHHLHMSGIERARVDVPVRLARAIDDSPEVAAVLAERALALGGNPREEALFLIGHGPNSAEDDAEWMRNLRDVAAEVQAKTGFSSVRVGLVRDDAPAEVRAQAVRGVRETIELQNQATGRPVIVVPILISTGQVSAEKVPADLSGLPVVYDGQALTPHPGMARWIEARVRQTVATALLP